MDGINALYIGNLQIVNYLVKFLRFETFSSGYYGVTWNWHILCVAMIIWAPLGIVSGMEKRLNVVDYDVVTLWCHTRLDRVSGFICNVSLVDATRERFLRFIPW